MQKIYAESILNCLLNYHFKRRNLVQIVPLVILSNSLYQLRLGEGIQGGSIQGF